MSPLKDLTLRPRLIFYFNNVLSEPSKEGETNN